MTQISPASSATAGANPAVNRFHCPGLAHATLDHGRLSELHLTLTPLPGERWADACRRLHSVLRDEGAAIAWQLAFGNAAACDEALADLKREFGKVNWPVTWSEGADLAGGGWSGMQILAVRGVKTEPVETGGEILACQYRDESARRVLLGGLGPDDLSATKPAQATRAFERLEAALGQAGLNTSHLVRTWLFLDDILGWYGDFNKARTEFFRSRRMFDGLVPASTGVGARNPRGAAVALAALAMQSVTGRPIVREIASPAQCPATSYGSSFSRALELALGRCRQVIVSGTASIEPGGKSARPNDLVGQIELTFEVVGDILKSRGLGFADTARAVAYFKDASGAQLFTDWLARRGLQNLPLISTIAAVCREELLFELELDAAAPPTSAT
jgi:enamine deaminase RidA (YjgF/YER057c/UK114 family)